MTIKSRTLGDALRQAGDRTILRCTWSGGWWRVRI